MYGDVVRILRGEDVIETSRWRDRDHPEYTASLGGVNLSIVNVDPITFGARVMGLPSMGELANMLVPSDSEPVFTTNEQVYEVVELDKKVHKNIIELSKVLSDVNKQVTAKTQAKNGEATHNGTFLLTNGSLVYQGSHVKYDYMGKDILGQLDVEIGNLDNVVGSSKAKKITIDESKIQIPKHDTPEFKGKFKMFTDKEIEDIGKMDVFTNEFNFGKKLAHVCKYNFYFPFDYYAKQLEKGYDAKPEKHAIVSDWRYRVLEREATFSTELVFDITFGDMDIEITQVIDWVDLKA